MTTTETDLATQATELRGEMEAMAGRITGQIAKFAWLIILMMTALELTLLALTVTLIIAGAT